MGSLGVRFNSAGPGQHVPTVKRAIRTIKSKVRGIIKILPYSLPRNNKLFRSLPTDLLIEVSYYTPGDCDIRVGTLNRHGLDLSDTSSGDAKVHKHSMVLSSSGSGFSFPPRHTTPKVGALGV